MSKFKVRIVDRFNETIGDAVLPSRPIVGDRILMTGGIVAPVDYVMFTPGDVQDFIVEAGSTWPFGSSRSALEEC